MKNIILSFFVGGVLVINAQQANALNVLDTRDVNDLPNGYQKEVKAEFKIRNILGVPGDGYFSGMLTIAPWSDQSGDKVHQLNFNNGGIFYRNGLQSSQWGSWGKIVIEDIYGNITGGDLISGGANAWRFHTPDDGRSSMYIAPLLTNGNGDWGIATEFKGGNIAVKGRLEAREVKVTQTPTADFVFEENYDLPNLEDVEKYIKEKRHLPEVASAREMEKEGVNLGEFQIKLLQKIEELTLYVIEQNKQIRKQSDQIKELQAIK